MYIHEDIALQMAKARIDDAVRTSELQRAMHFVGGRTSARAFLGKVLVRLGHWMMHQSSAAQSTPSRRLG